MQPHQQRVIDEKTELDTKIQALIKFINGDNPVFKSLDNEEQDRLVDQLEIMSDYSDILAERIAAFKWKTLSYPS